MNNLLTILQLVFALGLIIAILLQAQGSGLGNIFGGGGETYRSKRGAEKILLWVTIALAAGFLLISVLNLIGQ